MNAAGIAETALIFSGLGNLAFAAGVVSGRIGPFSGRPRVDVRLVPGSERAMSQPADQPPGTAAETAARDRQRVTIPAGHSCPNCANGQGGT